MGATGSVLSERLGEEVLRLSFPSWLLDIAGRMPPLRAAVAHAYEDRGGIRPAAAVLAGAATSYGRRMGELARALDAGELGLPVVAARPAAPFNGRVVMALHSAPPLVANGYTTRTLCLLKALSAKGIACFPATRPGFPQDQAVFRHVPPAPHDEADGIRFVRLGGRMPLWEGPLSDYVIGFADALAHLAAESGASVIHAASNHVCGLAACLAAERSGVRSVYEVRGLWHWSTVFRRPGWEGTEAFALHEALERQAALRADRVVVLSQALAEHVQAWGVPADRIIQAANGVDTGLFMPFPRNDELRRSWGAGSSTLAVGFVGTFTPYEGLDTLLLAIEKLRERGVDTVAVLIGDGEERQRLQAMARKLCIPAAFPGPVPFAEVPRMLSSMDVCPFPRRDAGSVRLVPPLKLAEAMACGVPVAVSNLPPLVEMTDGGRNGIVAGDGPDALADALMAASRERARAATARQWVLKHRTWDIAAAGLLRAWRD